MAEPPTTGLRLDASRLFFCKDIVAQKDKKVNRSFVISFYFSIPTPVITVRFMGLILSYTIITEASEVRLYKTKGEIK